MKPKLPPFLFWFGFLLRFFVSRFYLAVPGLILLLFGIGSRTCLVLGLLMLSVDAVFSFSDQMILKRSFENPENNPQLDSLNKVFNVPEQHPESDSSEGDYIDVEATETDLDDHDEER